MTTSRNLFGTDGIRGMANTPPMTVEIAQRLGQTVGIDFLRFHRLSNTHKPHIVIGKDTRLSGYMIESALMAGFLSSGMDVTLAGPIPTPAVAMLTRSLRADLGVMISASHNSYEDNGIKLFGNDGYKLSDKVEARIESMMNMDLQSYLPKADHIGRANRLNDAAGRYIEHLKNSFPKNLRLDGLKIVVDCANGAAYKVAPTALWELGAHIIPLGCDPNGKNINQNCGSTFPENLCEAVLEHKADIGVALDGDADRMLLADEKGRLINGDQILALIANNWQEKGCLRGPQVVATIMSNMGLERYLQEIGLQLERTAVGDRYVVERMRELGINLGGEQSGHIILSDFATTGDGLLSALQVLAALIERQKPASELCSLFDPFPQLLCNLKFSDGNPLEKEVVQKAVKKATQLLGKNGRIVLRKSGTEPVIRVMAEAEDADMVTDIVSELCDIIRVS